MDPKEDALRNLLAIVHRPAPLPPTMAAEAKEEGEMMKKLWEVDHPYYCYEGNYYKPGHHHEYASWASFMQEFGDSDPELNLVYRWDWRREWDDEAGEYSTLAGPKLLVFAMLQRKGICQSYEVSVLPDDEPAVREWLTGRMRHLLAVWTPLAATPAPAEGE